MSATSCHSPAPHPLPLPGSRGSGRRPMSCGCFEGEGFFKRVSLVSVSRGGGGAALRRLDDAPLHRCRALALSSAPARVAPRFSPRGSRYLGACRGEGAHPGQCETEEREARAPRRWSLEQRTDSDHHLSPLFSHANAALAQRGLLSRQAPPRPMRRPSRHCPPSVPWVRGRGSLGNEGARATTVEGMDGENARGEDTAGFLSLGARAPLSSTAAQPDSRGTTH